MSTTLGNLFEPAGLGKILHIFAVSMGILQILPLIFTNFPFPWIMANFFKYYYLGNQIFFLIFVNPLIHMG